MAAKKVFFDAEPILLAYEFCDDEVLEKTPEKLRRENLVMLTDGEIRELLAESFEKIPESVQVVFANQLCEDCGQRGDPRLMDDKCHKEKVRGHTGTLEQRFPKAQAAAAALGSIAGAIGLGAAAGTGGAGAEMALFGLPLVLAPGSFCTMHRLLNTQSKDSSRCLRINDMRYTCCRKGESNEGCAFMCTCSVIWGNGPPCVLIRHPDPNAGEAMDEYEVFKKDHSLVDIVLEEEK